MANIITRLLLDASSHDKGLEKAQRSLDKYIEKNVSAGNVIQGLAGTVGKMAGAVGLAMGATEAFDKVMHSSQTTGDEWDNTLNACKGTVDAFFRSISTGDWSAFNGGIFETIKNMKELSALRDALDDAKLSMGYNTRSFEREYVRLEGIIDDNTKSKEDREKAFAQMEELITNFKRDVEDTAKGSEKTLLHSLKARFGMEFTTEDLDKYFSVINNEFSTRKEAKGFRAYREQLKALESQKGAETKYNMYSGRTLNSEGRDIQNQIELLKAKNVQYEKFRILNEEVDEQRKIELQELEYILELRQRGDEYVKRSLEKQNKIAELNKTKGESKITVEAAKGSIAYMQQELKKLQTEYANAATDAARMAAIKAIREMEADIRMMNRSAENPLTQGTPSFKQSLPNDLYEVNFKPLISQKDVKTTDDYINGLNALANVMSAVNTASLEGAAGFFQWATGCASATSAAIEAIKELIPAKTAEGAANAGAEAAKTPVIGWLLVGGAIASALAAFASIPSFAEGGVVPGANFRDGVAARLSSGEMVINPHDQKKLYDSIRRGEMGGGGGRAIVTGEQIVLAVNNYGKRSGKGILIKS